MNYQYELNEKIEQISEQLEAISKLAKEKNKPEAELCSEISKEFLEIIRGLNDRVKKLEKKLKENE